MASLITRPDAPASAAAGDLPPIQPEGVRRPLVQRFQLITVCLAFLGLTLSQQPGRIVADTKLDLAVDPWAFLGRALQLWEAEGFAGQVQNQAYGYLFPMGPFFAAGSSAGIPTWVVQRLWVALLLSVAFLGAVTLARRLKIGTPEAQLVGGLAYALAPRMISGLGATSVEVLPMALAPWVLVPLVAGAGAGSPRRAGALSGLAVFCVGGVNAVATAAVLPLAVLWLLTRPAGPRRRRLMAWWVASVGLATAWWVGPLLLLGRYSPPFLDYIETAATTTGPTGLLSTLRGTTQWVAYLSGPDGPLWPAGWALVHQTVPIVATVVLAAAGLLGLARAQMPERTWLVLGLVSGLVLVTAGHLGTVQGLVAEPLHDALDGVLAPLRNVHKFDPVLRLPLALGVAYLCGELFGRLRHPDRGRWRPVGHAGIALLVLSLVAVASPAVAGRLSASAGFEAVPGYWEDTAEWLREAQPSGRALLVPASSFGTYAWGTTADEPMQPLAESPWEVRSAIPLTPGAHIRMLDAIEERLAAGEGSAGLARYLARAGYSHLVVRNDLDAGLTGATRPVLVQQALRNSPGITRVARFGPRFPGAGSFDGRELDAGLATPRPAVEIYRVADSAPAAYSTSLDSAVEVAGGPDAVLALEERGLLTDRPTFLVGNGEPPRGEVMVSDAQLRRERTFGRIADAVSAGLAPEDPLRLDAPARDYGYPGAALGESVVRFDGGSVAAASSASDADSFGRVRPENQPYAAVDGDATTAWRPADRLGRPQEVWWRLVTDEPIAADSIVVQFAAGSGVPEELLLTTDAGERTVQVADPTRPQRLELPAGTSHSLTISVPGDESGRTTKELAIAEVLVPGFFLGRAVVTPAPEQGAAVYAFDAANPATGGCVTDAALRVRCAPVLVRAAEEPVGIDRVFTVARPASFPIAVTARPRPGTALDALIAAYARPSGPMVGVSSAAVPDPRAGADAAVDGDPSTVWTASAGDSDPTVTVNWPQPRTVDRLRIVPSASGGVSRPTAVSISDGGLPRTAELDEDGVANFPALTTDRLTVSFPLREETTSFDPYTRVVTTLGVGFADLSIDGVPAGDPATVVDVPCGEGPAVEVDGRLLETSVQTTVGALRGLQPVDLRFCSTAPSTRRLAAGEHRFAARSTETFAVESATLGGAAGAAGSDGAERTPVRVTRWDAEHRVVQVSRRSEPTLLVVPENVNPGWVGSLDGERLESVPVDGWQQGYVLPAGPAGEVDLEFGAGTAYRTALFGGAVAVLALLCLLLVPVRHHGPPPAGRRSDAGPWVALVLIAATAAFGGVVGLLVLAVTAGLARAVGGRRQASLAVLAASSLLTAGAVAMVTGTVWQAGAGGVAVSAVQTAALVAVSAVVASVLIGVRLRGVSGSSFRHRRVGSSTSA